MDENEVIENSIGMKKWAVVGASPNPERYGNKIVKLLKERGYTVYPVRPATAEVHGLKCYPSISDLPERVDVVDMVVNPETGLKVMEEIRDAGTEYVWLQPGAESNAIHLFARENHIHAIDACVLAVLAVRKGRAGTGGA